MHCKICQGDAPLFGVVDLTKNCNEQSGFFLPPSGIGVYYYRCTQCEFIFTPYFDDFTDDAWKSTIYNDGYASVDPLYAQIRPQANADFFRNLMRSAYGVKVAPHIMDYGAGNGRFSELMLPDFTVTNYDPFNPRFAVRPAKAADIIFSSEVLEHAASPISVVADWAALLNVNGAVLFSTMLQPADVDIAWWYISPRNGHISIYSKPSLERLFADAGMCYHPLSEEWHVAMNADAKGPFAMDRLTSIIAQLPTGFIEI